MQFMKIAICYANIAAAVSHHKAKTIKRRFAQKNAALHGGMLIARATHHTKPPALTAALNSTPVATKAENIAAILAT